MEWVYVAVAVIATMGAFTLGRMVREKSTKRRVAAWMAVLFGAGFFLTYALKLDQDVFFLVVGLVCVISGINADMPAERNALASAASTGSVVDSPEVTYRLSSRPIQATACSQ